MKRLLALPLLLGMLLPAAALADGMIVVPSQPATFPLAVKYHRVQVTINDAVARTSVDQEFFNPTSARLEGVYIFPLPRGAAISDFTMEIDGRATRAELLDATKARGIYEEIVRKMRDPALLEYAGNGAFRVRIYPIEPRSGKRIRLSYSEVLKQESGLHAYTYSLNTEKFSSTPLEEVAIRVDLQSTRGLKTIFCPTHEVEIKRKNGKAAVIGFEEKRSRPDKDFTLYFSTDDEGVGLSAVCHRPPGEDGYFLLTVTPAYDNTRAIVPKDITFVLDVSGSMAGKKMTQAKRAILFCLDHLNSGDRFEIVRFSTDAEALFGRLADASRKNIADARDYIDRLEPIGGTNADEALALALKSNDDASGRPKVVMFITDGKPTIGETDDERLVKKIRDANRRRMRVFTFGIGDDLNTHFLDKLTEATRAARTYVGETEDVAVPVARFHEMISAPVLVDLAIEFGGGVKASQTYPRNLPDLFKGRELIVFGRYSGSGSAVTLTGTVDGRRVTLPYTARFPAREDANEVIAPLWATQRIGFLLDELRLHGEEKELIDEVTRLARRFGVITPYTSYLIMKDERVNVAANNQTMNAMPAARMKADYDAMKQKSGASSVQASVEVEGLMSNTNISTMKQGRARMEYKDAGGVTKNLAMQNRNVQGRAVYQVGENWVDSKIQTMKNQNARRIRFASPAYFDLLTKEPQAAQFLALGRNVRFALREQIYEVYE